MRKRINILFVALAISSVTYGMVLRYSDKTDETLSVGAELPPQEAELTQDEFVRFSDDIVDLDALVTEPD